MGAEQSNQRGNIKGYQIVWVLPDSPAEKALLSPFFDFIVSVDQVDLSDNTTLKPTFFVEYIQKTVNQPVRLGVFSTKTCELREVNLVPRDDWGGDGLLGCSIRYQQVSKSLDLVWHILDVEQNSPSHIIGLEAFTDFVVGCQRNLFDTPDDFSAFLKETLRNHESLLMMVYSTKAESFREVLLTPNLRAVMRSGSLGCDIGTGYIHQIPPTVKGRAFVTCQMLSQTQIQEEQARQVDISNRMLHEFQALLRQQQEQYQIQSPPPQRQQQQQPSVTVNHQQQQQRKPQHDYDSIDNADVPLPGLAAAAPTDLTDRATHEIIHKVSTEIAAHPDQSRPNNSTPAAAPQQPQSQQQPVQQPQQPQPIEGSSGTDDSTNILSYIENQLENFDGVDSTSNQPR